MKTLRNLASDRMLSVAFAGLTPTMRESLLAEDIGSSAEADARMLELVTSDYAILTMLRAANGDETEYDAEEIADYRSDMLAIINARDDRRPE
jgi:hypothetical protein